MISQMPALSVVVHFSQWGGFEMVSRVWAPAELAVQRAHQLKQKLQRCFERWKEAGATQTSCG